MELARPNVRYRDSVVDALREKIATHACSPADVDEIARDFAAYVTRLDARVRADLDTTYWMIDGEVCVGRITLRHRLDEALALRGGHVGYDVRPAYRRRGHATAALAQLLPLARARGLSRLLVTCDATNLASIGVIRANRGVFRDEIQIGDDAVPTRRYWIVTGP